MLLAHGGQLRSPACGSCGGWPSSRCWLSDHSQVASDDCIQWRLRRLEVVVDYDDDNDDNDDDNDDNDDNDSDDNDNDNGDENGGAR
jgi:hypothetical protein